MKGRVLLAGVEKAEAMAILIALAGFKVQSTIDAANAYYVDGLPLYICALKYKVDKSNLHRDLAKLEALAKNIDAYNLVNRVVRV